MKNSDRKVQVMFFGPFSQKGGQPVGILVLSRFFFFIILKIETVFQKKSLHSSHKFCVRP